MGTNALTQNTSPPHRAAQLWEEVRSITSVSDLLLMSWCNGLGDASLSSWHHFHSQWVGCTTGGYSTSEVVRWHRKWSGLRINPIDRLCEHECNGERERRKKGDCSGYASHQDTRRRAARILDQRCGLADQLGTPLQYCIPFFLFLLSLLPIFSLFLPIGETQRDANIFPFSLCRLMCWLACAEWFRYVMLARTDGSRRRSFITRPWCWPERLPKCTDELESTRLVSPCCLQPYLVPNLVSRYDFFKSELLKTAYFEDNIFCHFTASFAAVCPLISSFFISGKDTDEVDVTGHGSYHRLFTR